MWDKLEDGGVWDAHMDATGDTANLHWHACGRLVFSGINHLVLRQGIVL